MCRSVFALLLVAGPVSIPVAFAQARGTSFGAGLDTRLSYNISSRLGGWDGAEWVGELSPSLRLQRRSGRLVGYLEYGLTLVERSRTDPHGETINRLASNLTAELVQRHLYFEGSAAIAQQSISPFGLQTSARSLSVNPNRAETGNVSLSPVLRGTFGGAVNLEARLNASAVNTRRTLVGDSVQTGGSLSMSSAVARTLITWGLTARTTETDFRIGRSTRSDSAGASLSWQADSDLGLTARAGSELQDVQAFEARRTATWGVGATWRPSPRTRFQADVDDRYFGRGYNVVAEYRMPRSSVTWSGNRDSNAAAGTRVADVTQFQQFMALYEADFPDPAEREVAVRERLTALGLDPLQVVQPGFVSPAATVAERHQLGWAWNGKRLSISAQAFRSTSTVVDAAASEIAREPVRLSGYSANLLYRLSPTGSITATGSRQLTRATSTRPSNDLQSASMTYTERLGRRTNASLSARYSVFSSTVDPYREASLTASLAMRF